MYLSAVNGLILSRSANWRNTNRLRFERAESASRSSASAIMSSPLMPEFSGFLRYVICSPQHFLIVSLISSAERPPSMPNDLR